MSFVGFFAHYLDLIGVSASSNPSIQRSPPKLHPASAANLPLSSLPDERPEVKLIFGGYSYGSIIVSRLPCPREILSHIRGLDDDSAMTEILQRARTISGWTSQKLEGTHPANTNPKKLMRPHSPSITMGGEETMDQRRVSKEGGRKSVDLDGLKKSLDIPRRIKEHKNHSRSRENTPSHHDEEIDDLHATTPFKAQYLMISPVLGLVGSALSAFGNPNEVADLKTTLAKEPTLVVYGDKDVFTSTRKTQQWTQKLSSTSDRFCAVEVNGAGHFWQERGAIERMRNAVGLWVRETQTTL